MSLNNHRPDSVKELEKLTSHKGDVPGPDFPPPDLTIEQEKPYIPPSRKKRLKKFRLIIGSEISLREE